MSKTMEDRWHRVEGFLEDAHLIAWDTCHKIYVAMDERQAQWFREEYAPDIFTGTTKEMLAMLHKWYDASCGLKFISSVQSVPEGEDPNRGFIDLIEQGAEFEDDDYDDYDYDEDEDED